MNGGKGDRVSLGQRGRLRWFSGDGVERGLTEVGSGWSKAVAEVRTDLGLGSVGLGRWYLVAGVGGLRLGKVVFGGTIWAATVSLEEGV